MGGDLCCTGIRSDFNGLIEKQGLRSIDTVEIQYSILQFVYFPIITTVHKFHYKFSVPAVFSAFTAEYADPCSCVQLFASEQSPEPTNMTCTSRVVLHFCFDIPMFIFSFSR